MGPVFLTFLAVEIWHLSNAVMLTQYEKWTSVVIFGLSKLVVDLVPDLIVRSVSRVLESNGNHMSKSRLFVSLIFIPVSICLCFTDKILIACQIDRAISLQVANLIRI